MSSWLEVQQEILSKRLPKGGVDLDGVRRSKMDMVSEYTRRPLIVYAVDFLNQQKVQAAGSDINIDWSDKEGFMEVIQGIEGDSVDILVHSPGGMAEAAHSVVEILRSHFKDIRFIVPNIAKSAATMLVLSGNSILMDEMSELGPIDPQFLVRRADGGILFAPAQAIIDQFEKAVEHIAANPKLLAPWIPILQQYGPSLYQQAKTAIDLSRSLVEEWLVKYMFAEDENKSQKAQKVAKFIGDHNNFKSHAKRIGLEDLAREPLSLLNVVRITEDEKLRSCIRALYHAISITFSMSAAFKIFENTEKRALIRQISVVSLGKEPKN